MTRINVVPVTELCDQHLLAEHRELTRIPNGILSGKLKVHYDDRPLQYTLGEGHVKFFTNKTCWLLERYILLHAECINRKFHTNYRWPMLGFRDQVWKSVDYTPTEQDMEINRTRIKERWPKNARYYGKPYVDKE